MLTGTSTTDSAENGSQDPSLTTKFLGWHLSIIIFLAAACLTTMHHLFEPGIKVALQFDGRHYFETCQRISTLIFSLFSFKSANVQAAESALRPWLLLDGPVLPTLFGTFYSLMGKTPGADNWSLLVVLQTVLHSLTVAAVATLAYKLTGERRWALLSAAIWATYPPAVINTGRLMTETSATLLFIMLPLSLTSMKSQMRAALVAGTLCGWLIMLKPGMVPSVMLCAGIATLYSKRRIPFAALLLLAGLIALSPWLLYTKMVTGKASITVQRLPVHNAMIGWDWQTSGWQTSPASRFEQVMNVGNEPLPVVEGIWISHPKQCWELLLRKFGHLYLSPWNDYRSRFIGIDAFIQQYIHCFVLVGGLLGAIFSLFKLAKMVQDVRKLTLVCIAAVAGQFVYLLFEPVCRYAFPQMVFAPVFLALGAKLTRAVKYGTQWIIAASCLTILLAVALPNVLGDSRALNEEQSLIVQKNQTVGKKWLFSKPVDTAFDNAYLLIDCDQNFKPASVQINGHSIPACLISFQYTDENRYNSFNLLREFAYVLGTTVPDLRQWRAIPVPVSFLRDQKCINVVVQQSDIPATLFSDTDGIRRISSPDFLNVNRMINSTNSLEPRVYDPVLSGDCASATYLDGKKISLPIRIKLALARPLNQSSPPLPLSPPSPSPPSPSPPSPPSPSPSPSPPAHPAVSTTDGTWSIIRSISKIDFDPLLRSDHNTICISRSILKNARSNSTEIKFASPQTANGNLAVTVNGFLRCNRPDGELGLVVTGQNDSKAQFILGQNPKSLKATTQWQQFQIDEYMPNYWQKSKVDTLILSLFPGPWQQVAGYGCDKSCADIEIKDLTVRVRPAEFKSLTGEQTFYY